MVRPWKEFLVDTMRARPVAFTASFRAASLASAPLLQNMETPRGPGDTEASASAASACSLTR
ncbi:MAG: hypothetical protein A4E29_01139 [Methanomassiliicoccales archaeon PtaB.Bin134]|nr:MAG: hypothetical protein A4E29_01139 [Methanomassiliicoccales archaeon PtaB.Bin134]